MPRSRWLDTLPPDISKRLSCDAVRMTYANDTLIQARGERKAGLSMIVSGNVRFGTTGASGAFIQFALMGAGDVYGEMTIFNGGGRVHDAIAVGPVVIDQLSAERALAIFETHPALQMALLRLMAKRLQFAYENIDAIIRSPLVDRIGGQLLSLARFIKADILNLRQCELAESLGASRVAVNKALGQLTALGFVSTGYGTVTLVDRNALRHWLDARRDVARL